jgi:threonine dehydratase
MFSPSEIRSNYEVIAPHIRRTSIIELDGTDFGVSVAGLVLKLESLQHAGSFKTRGAITNLLTRTVPRAGGTHLRPICACSRRTPIIRIGIASASCR